MQNFSFCDLCARPSWEIRPCQILPDFKRPSSSLTLLRLISPNSSSSLSPSTSNDFTHSSKTLLFTTLPCHVPCHMLKMLEINKCYIFSRDKTKTQFMSTAAVVFQKFEVSLWEMFVEIFQRLHVVICLNEDPTKGRQSLNYFLREIGIGP